MPLNIDIDDNQLLRQPELHDADLIGLKNTQPSNLEIELNLARGQRIKAVLENVSALKCDNYSFQNVILECEIAKSVQVGTVYDEDLTMLGFLDDQSRAGVKARIQQGSCCLFKISASVGCEVLAIAAKVEFHEV